ncbi:MAG: glycoside hydrolase family 30 protein [Phaeodactylibacter sp.]|nr:glycoside hydrolase family 30 protein [Phaeodactylibacter sp.]MCB9275371.1 glycoside hydrolase family 30 protein [Lewinellaceae bacterium]
MRSKVIILLPLLVLGSVAVLHAQASRASNSGPARVRVFTTAANTEYRLSETAVLNLKPFGQPLETQECIFVDPTHTFQEFLGIGGALTDAAAETFAKLPAEKQKEVLQAYFDPEKGIGYTLARVNIHSCDFSSGSYTYVEDKDVSLKSFSVNHDEQYRIPFVKRAIAAAGGSLTIFASPWSPPAWMKDNNDMLHGGKLLPEYRQAWANYFVKFVNAYEKAGIPIWGVSVQNEPMATQTWESCIWTAEDERDFVRDYLGPTFHKQGLKDKNIIIWDHNRDLMYQRASTVLNDAEAAKYVWGTGFHWYAPDNFENVKRVQESFPDKKLLFTEGCTYPFNLDKVYEWHWGEQYGKSMVNDLNNGSVGWTDWNVLLDETGGPNHVGNFCFSPIHGDTRTGELYYMSSYYYIGHFSRFIRPGARRIISSSNRDRLQTTAFKNPDGTVAVVVLNLGDDAVSFQFWLDGQAAPATSLPHSIMTLVF